MELHEIRYFLAVAEVLNFTRAAERCHVSQPALTRAIRNLEDKLGAGPLINRERGNTHLTELGRTMQPYFEATLRQLEAARSQARAHARLTDTALSLGIMCTVGPTRLIELVADFTRRHPGIEIHLSDGPVDAIEKRLIEGGLDVAIYCRPQPLEENLHTLPLFRERFVVALPPDDPLAKRNGLRIADLNGHRYLGRAACEYHEHLRDMRVRMGGIEFEHPYTSDRDDWIQSMVRAGLGFTYLPELAVTLPDLVTRPLVEPEVWRTVQLVTVRGRPHAPAVGAFVEAARRHAWDGKVALGRSAADARRAST